MTTTSFPKLTASTATAQGVSHFGVERRAEGGNWTEIARLNATKNGTESSYVAYDASPPDGTTYYRIRQEDHNGTFTFSDVAVVRLRSVFTVAPNPGSDHLRVTHSGNERVLYHLENLAGTRVLSKVLASGGRLSLAGVPAGVYLVRSAGGLVRVVVQ